MQRIITHPGKAHRDDFISVCLVLDHLRGPDGSLPEVERKEPSVDEILDDTVWCIDVGGDHTPSLRNFDHHQLPRDAAPRCALSLILTELGLEEAANKASGEWIAFTEMLDCKGPIFTGKHFDISREAMLFTQSPIEAQMLKLWEERPNELALRWYMAAMGAQWKKYWTSHEDRMKLLQEICSLVPVRKTKGVLFVPIDRNDNPSFGVERFCLLNGINPSVVVSPDDRGPGYTLYRRNDDPSIDFGLVKDDERIAFAHANGFVAKTVSDLDRYDLIDLVEKSVTSKKIGMLFGIPVVEVDEPFPNEPPIELMPLSSYRTPVAVESEEEPWSSRYDG